MKLHVITPCSRPENLKTILETVRTNSGKFDVHWWVAVDNKAKRIPGLTKRLTLPWITHFRSKHTGEWGNELRNECLERIDSGLVYFLDDDNIVHPYFYPALWKSVNEAPNATGWLFSQLRHDGEIISVKDALEGKQVDTAMFVFTREQIGKVRWIGGYASDSYFFRTVARSPSRLHVTDIPVVLYNSLRLPE